MSLRVWLPLDGDLRNQGTGGESSIVSSGSSSITNGKIGSCMKITSTTDTKYVPNFNTSGLSFGGWFRFNQSEIATVINAASYTSTATTPTGNVLGNTSYGGIGLVWTGNNHYSSGTFSSMNVFATLRTASVNNSTSSIAITFGTWIHIMLTWDPVTHELSLYKDGALVNVKTFNAFTDGVSRTLYLNYKAIYGGNGPSLNIPIDMNDIRIYDHALSAAEVHEIAQGLVLHYSLDRKNLHPIGTNLVTGVTKGGQTSLLTDERVGVVTSGTNADTYFTVNLSENITNGTTYYLSCDVSGVSDGQYWGFPLGAQSNTSMPSKFYNGHNEYVFTANDINWGTNRLFLDDNYRNDYAHPASFYNFVLIKNPTFEAVDESGYGNNSISNAPVTSSSDTMRYNEASYFGTYNTPNLTLSTPTTLLPSLTSCTITWWAKYDTTKTLLLTGHTTNHYVAASNNNNYYHGNAGSPVMYKDGIQGTYKCAADGWHHFALTGVNLSTWTALKLNGYGSGWPLNGYISDLRIYATALTADDILALYHTGAKIDNKQNLHTFELNETNTNLLSGILWCAPFSSHTPLTSPFTNYNSNGEPQFTSNSTSAGSDYIEISPTGHTYEYDYTISVNAGNQFYIGFERYDADKTARSNNACVYTFASKPSSDIVKQHYTGTINLATDGTNPCKYIALRILNGWSGTTSGVTGTATIHSISLRQIGTKQQPKITKTGLCIGEELKEETNTKLHKNGIIETNNLIEL